MLVARMVIAATMAFALVSGTVPLGFSSGHLCTMACCACLPPHAAGSCSHGSCHAHLSVRKPKPPPAEKLCGAHRQQTAQRDMMRMRGMTAPPAAGSSPADRLRDVTVDFSAQESSPQGDSPRTPTVAASILTRPCPPDCGVGMFSSSTQSRPRETAALSYANRPRPPSGELLAGAPHHLAKELDVLCRRSRPRGPPVCS